MIDPVKMTEAYAALEKAIFYDQQRKNGCTKNTTARGIELFLTKACKLELEALGYRG